MAPSPRNEQSIDISLSNPHTLPSPQNEESVISLSQNERVEPLPKSQISKPPSIPDSIIEIIDTQNIEKVDMHPPITQPKSVTRSDIKNNIKEPLVGNNVLHNNDIKNSDISIGKMNNRQSLKVNEKELDTEPQIVSVVNPSVTVEEKEELTWPDLSIDDINTSLKVIGDIPEGSKLKIIDKKHLAKDDSYFVSIARYNEGQGRERIISFLEHLHSETKRNVDDILKDIRNGINIDNNVCVLRGIVCKLAVFLHKYESMRTVYKSDSSAYARLGNNRDKFYVFLDTLFRDMTVPK